MTGNNVSDLFNQVRNGVRAVSLTALNSVTELTRSINQFTRQFVEAFRPDVVKRFDYANRQLLATIGEGLTPVMELATRGLRVMGDTINGVYRNIRPLVDQGLALLGKVFGDLFQVAKQLASVFLGATIPVMEQLLSLANQLSEPFAKLAGELGRIVGAVVQVAAVLGGILVDVLTSLVPLVNAVVESVSTLVTIVVSQFQAVASVVGPLVKIALTQFMVALKAIGSVLSVFQPLLKAFAEGMAEIANEMAALVGDVLTQMLELFGEFYDALGELLSPMREFIGLITNELVVAVRVAVGSMKMLIESVRALLGVSRYASGPRSVEGERRFAAGTPQFTTAEAAWRDIISAGGAFGANTSQDYAKTTAESTAEIAKWLNTNGQTLMEWAVIARDRAKQAGSAVSDAAGFATGAALPGYLMTAFRQMVLK